MRPLGALAYAAALIAFGALAWLVRQPGIPPIDPAVTRALHDPASPSLDALMNAVTGLGSSVVLVAVVACVAGVLAVRRHRAEAVLLVLALGGTLVLNDVLKSIVQRPRPDVEWAAVWPESSFPSGHSMNSLVIYLALALVTWRLAGHRVGVVALVLAATVPISVGISRIYLGAHWMTDVIGGYLAGGLWLSALVVVWTGRVPSPSAGRSPVRAPDQGASAGV